eukprot:7547005-Pyramimonas_sp.AAC.1
MRGDPRTARTKLQEHTNLHLTTREKLALLSCQDLMPWTSQKEEIACRIMLTVMAGRAGHWAASPGSSSCCKS